MARFNRTLAGTGAPIRLSDFATAATAGEQLPPQWVVNFFVQMAHGGSALALGYVMTGIKNGLTPNPATDGQLTAELAPATANAPGGTFMQNQQAFGSPLAGVVDLTRTWVQASVGDNMIVSWDTNN